MVVLGVTVCTGGDTVLSIGSSGGVAGECSVVGPGLLGSAAGQMNFLFLVY